MHNRPLITLILLTVTSASLSIAADNSVTSLFEFSSPSDSTNWQIVNDGVMGGRSSSRIAITEDGYMRFSGTLSLANNGGFASVRSRPAKLGLMADRTISLRVKGDGRRYTFNLYTADRRTAFSFQKEFETKSDEWIEVKLPVREFVAHSFGRPLPSEKLDPTQIRSIGILLGDKRAGSFEILVDWIRIE